VEMGEIQEESEDVVVKWLRAKLGVLSRSELKDNREAAQQLFEINEAFTEWKHLNA